MTQPKIDKLGFLVVGDLKLATSLKVVTNHEIAMGFGVARVSISGFYRREIGQVRRLQYVVRMEE